MNSTQSTFQCSAPSGLIPMAALPASQTVCVQGLGKPDALAGHGKSACLLQAKAMAGKT